jgi:cytochrome c biogenesis protein CcmG, thiol:disulfide interchange protein DsbE
MNPRYPARSLALLAAVLAASLAFAQSAPPPAPAPAVPPTPATAPTPAKPSPVSGIRNKISAGDLLSAESILEVHREKNGEDGPYLVGLSWLARGALLLGEDGKTRRYVADVRAKCAEKLKAGADLEKDDDLEIALGAAIEVEAQRIERKQGSKAAGEFVRKELAALRGPVALRSRLYKRLNMLTLVGQPAPELVIEDFQGAQPPTLAQLRGKPVLIFVWSQTCGDCRAQAAGLARAVKRADGRGLQTLALTRYYSDQPDHPAAKARADSVWSADYKDVGTIPMVFSTASMERYGGSSTPTFVFVDRTGIVRGYTPTRLTDAEFDKALAAIER